jgi:hypothetical protein
MNRRDRRAARAQGQTLARDRTPDEIFPPHHPHGPVQPQAETLMRTLLDFARDKLPGYDITVFLSERQAPEGSNRLPRFNYGSTCDRADMVAVLQAFIAKNTRSAEKLDKINEPPPTETRQ